MFGDIPQNVWGHSPECLATFHGMFGDIPRNITFPPIPRVPGIPFPVPVFLVLVIAFIFWGVSKSEKHVIWKKHICCCFINGTQCFLTADCTRNIIMLLSFKFMLSSCRFQLYVEFYSATLFSTRGWKVPERFGKFLLNLSIASYTKNLFTFLSFCVWNDFRGLFHFSICMPCLLPGHPVIFTSCHFTICMLSNTDHRLKYSYLVIKSNNIFQAHFYQVSLS